MSKAVKVVLLLALASLALPGCGEKDKSAAVMSARTESAPGPATSSFSLSSTSFESGGSIPERLTCEEKGGSNSSPQLGWTNPPSGTASFAVIMDDETPPCGKGESACMHWSVFNIPADRTSLTEAEDLPSQNGIALGRNYLGEDGYAGPCPPDPHVYKITVYALDAGMPLIKSGGAFTRAGFSAQYAAHILASDTIETSFAP